MKKKNESLNVGFDTTPTGTNVEASPVGCIVVVSCCCVGPRLADAAEGGASQHTNGHRSVCSLSLPLPNRMLQKAQETDYIDINCIDPLGRSALLMAIDNENLEMVELLINHNVDTKDALLHAISEEFVEAVEVLLDHEDSKLQTGGKHVNARQLDLHPRL